MIKWIKKKWNIYRDRRMYNRIIKELTEMNCRKNINKGEKK